MLGFKLGLLLCFLSIFAFADIHTGKVLFQEAKCMECHNVEDFSSPNAKVKTYKQLSQRVDACLHSTDASWFDEDTAYVVDYLNDTYYKFKKD